MDDLFGYIVNGAAVCFQKQDAGSVHCLRLYRPGAGLCFEVLAFFGSKGYDT